MSSLRSARAGSVLFILVLGALAGAALAATGDPVPGVDVSLEQKPGGNRVATKTAADGTFSFKDLPPGKYVLRIQKPAPSPRTGLGNRDVRRGEVVGRRALPPSSEPAPSAARPSTTATAPATPADPAPAPAGSNPASGAETSRNYNSIKSNTAGVAARPSSSVLLAVDALEAGPLQQAIPMDRLLQGSEVEVVVGARGTLSGRITAAAAGPASPAGAAATDPRTFSPRPVGGISLGSQPTALPAGPAAAPVILKGRLPKEAGEAADPVQVLLVEKSTGKVLAETVADADGAFALDKAEDPDKDDKGRWVCWKAQDGTLSCFNYTLLPAEPALCPQLMEEDTVLQCVELKK